MEQLKYNVFISYSRSDLKVVKDIKKAIERNTGVRCWMDLLGIESGEPSFTKAIIDGINESMVFLFMRSEASQASKYALRELNYATKRKKRVVLVNIDQSIMSDEFEFHYGMADTIYWFDQPQKEKLLRDLSKWCILEDAPASQNSANLSKQKYTTNIETEGMGKSKWQAPIQKVGIYLNKTNQFVENYWYIPACFFILLFAIAYIIDNYYLWGMMSCVAILYLIMGGLLYFYQTTLDPCSKGIKLAERGKYELAVGYYLKAVEQGDSVAQNNLGSCYYNGQGVLRDYSEAVKWFRKAIEQGYSVAQYNLGLCYFTGHGVPQDYSEAVKCYRIAAKQGNSDAQYNLGLCYYYGHGVTQDHSEAMKCYRKAAKQGNSNAQNKIKELGIT